MAKGSNKELVGASTGILILGILAQGRSWGYDIVRQMNDEADGAFTWNEGTVYPVLHKLEERGLIQSRWQESAEGRRRKYYGLTPLGRSELDEGTRQWAQFNRLIVKLAGAPHA